MNRKKRIIILTAAAVLTLATLLSGCGTKSKTPVNTEQKTKTKSVMVQEEDNTVTAWISEANPEQSILDLADVDTVTTALSEDGKRDVALVRIPLPAGITPDRLEDAYLYMKKSGGDDPQITVGAAPQSWASGEVRWNNFQMPDIGEKSATIEAQEDGWFRINVTECVRNWLRGDVGNAGFVLAEVTRGAKTEFYSGSGDISANYPKLRIRYKANKSKEAYGKYSYTEQADGNCLSYALRDVREILSEDLFADSNGLQYAYDGGGLSAALSYTKDAVFAYITANKDALKISKIRELSSRDEEIDTANEYRVAMRIGVRDSDDGTPVSLAENGAYDYHFRVQLKDGSWAEKLQGDPSRLTAGSNAELDPSKYPWDAAFQWGYEKWNDYYNSEPVYFAVTKTTDDFTSHR